MDFYLVIHSIFTTISLYFCIYSAQRIARHWKDGKEKARASGKRLIIKISATVAISILQSVHIADFSIMYYKKKDIIIRTIFFSVSSITWMLSAFLVYFDYSRRLKAQWWGQRFYWIFGVIMSSTLITMNALLGFYDDQHHDINTAILQIVSYIVSVFICFLLSFYAVFFPNDFTVISDDLYLRLKKSIIAIEETKQDPSENELKIKINIAGYKVRQILNNYLLSYNINININEVNYNIMRSIADFESLDIALREKFLKMEFENSDFPEFSMENLAKLSIDQRGEYLSSYLTKLCVIDFMTPDLLNFLQIEGDVRDFISFRHNQLIEEKIQSSGNPRSESTLSNYYTQKTTILSKNDIGEVKKDLQWLIKVSIESHRFDETSTYIDYYIKTDIKSLEFDKLRPYKYSDIFDFHKQLRKITGHSSLNFPFKNSSWSIRKNDREAIESKKVELEHYFSKILNDPAYLCKEALDFIGCDADLSQILTVIPSIKYRIIEEIAWEGGISDDSSHYIVYSIAIGKTKQNSALEQQWKILKRYREFDALHKSLVNRQGSPLLRKYLNYYKLVKDVPLPSLPSKSIAPLCTVDEIEERKKALSIYITELFNNPSVLCSFVFREFIEDKE